MDGPSATRVFKWMEDLFRLQPIYGLTLVIVIIYLVREIWAYVRRGRHYPPGPIGLPILGYIPFINGLTMHQDLYQLGKKYGRIYGLKLGQMETVVINDFEAMKESGRMDEYSDRPPYFFEWNDTPNIESLNGKPWKEQRKMLMTSIRSTLAANSKYEEKVKEQIGIALEDLKGCSGDVNVRDILSPVMNNLILYSVCGRNYEGKDATNYLLTNFRFKILEYFESVRVPSYFPSIYQMWTKLSPTLRKIRQEMSIYDQHMTEEIKEHQQSVEPNPELKSNYIDLYLAEAKKNPRFEIPVLLANCQVSLMAGAEFIRATVEWALLSLARHQLFQEQVHRQIIEVIGTDRLPEWKDREKLTLVRALILEIYRWKTLVPISDPHLTAKNAKLGSYKIPKGTMVLLNLWAVHNDESYWGDPENFRPDRFLSKDFRSIVNSERVIPFGIGKRDCPGEKLAELEIFLFLTALLQKYRFLPPKMGVNMEGMTFLSLMVVNPVISLELR